MGDLILVVPTPSVLMLTSVLLAHVLKASGATRTVTKVPTANKTKLLPISQAKPEMLSTLTPKSSLMTKNHSRPKRLAEMLPRCSRTLLVKLTARTRRVKHVSEQSNKKTLLVSVLLLIKLLPILKPEFIRPNLKLVSKLSVLMNQS